jgi:hypothetical protein
MIYGPKEDGSYVVEFRTTDGDVLAISIPRNEAAVFSEGSDLHLEFFVYVFEVTFSGLTN